MNTCFLFQTLYNIVWYNTGLCTGVQFKSYRSSICFQHDIPVFWSYCILYYSYIQLFFIATCNTVIYPVAQYLHTAPFGACSPWHSAHLSKMLQCCPKARHCSGLFLPQYGKLPMLLCLSPPWLHFSGIPLQFLYFLHCLLGGFIIPSTISVSGFPSEDFSLVWVISAVLHVLIAFSSLRSGSSSNLFLSYMSLIPITIWSLIMESVSSPKLQDWLSSLRSLSNFPKTSPSFCDLVKFLSFKVLFFFLFWSTVLLKHFEHWLIISLLCMAQLQTVI